MQWIVEPSCVSGQVRGTSSKSQAIRALLFAFLSSGTSRIEQLPSSPDIRCALTCFRQLGAVIEEFPSHVLVQGTRGHITAPRTPLDVGNSGLLLRFLMPLIALSHEPITITGDASIQTRRPVSSLIDALEQMGAVVEGKRPPLTIQGPIHSSCVTLDGADSQPVSALLILSAFLSGETTLFVTNPGELPWIDLTLDWLLGHSIRHKNYREYVIEGSYEFKPFTYRVPKDISSLGFPLAAAMITRRKIEMFHLDLSRPQGDSHLIPILEQMGAELSIASGHIQIQASSTIVGGTFDLNRSIDSVPLMASLACYAQHPTTLTHIAIARHKESDRLDAMTQELQKMGAKIWQLPDTLYIEPAPLHGACLTSHADHRIAMALAIAALGAQGSSKIDDVGCVAKSYPNFLQDMQYLGAKIRKV